MELFQESKVKIRNNNFLKSFNADKFKRKREEDIVELRKQKRTEQVLKKRFLLKKVEEASPEAYIPGSEYINFSQSLVTKDVSDKCPELLNPDLSSSERLFVLINYIQGLENPSDFLSPVKTLRNVLSQDRVCPIHIFMNTGISSKLINALSMDIKDLQIESLWCLINLASGPSHVIQKLLDNNIKEPLKKLLTSDDPELLDHTIWCIGNLVGDPSCPRCALVELVPLLAELINKTPQAKWNNIIWALSNFCRGKPYINRESTHYVLRIIPKILKTYDDDLLTDSCWTLTYISNSECERIQDIIDLGILGNLVGILKLEPGRYTLPCLRTLGNIIWGTNDQEQKILDLGFLDCVNKLLTQNKISLKKETLWMLSNIAAGSDEQIKQILEHPCMKIVLKCLEDPDIEIKNEAAWVVSNATNAQDKSLVLKVYEIGAFPLICDFLNNVDSKVIMVVLEGIDNLMWAGWSSEGNEIALKFDEIGGLTKMEALQYSRNLKVYNKVVEIMEKYWGVDEVKEADEGLLTTPQLFSFN